MGKVDGLATGKIGTYALSANGRTVRWMGKHHCYFLMEIEKNMSSRMGKSMGNISPMQMMVWE